MAEIRRVQVKNVYYSAALMGLAYADTHIVSLGSMLATLEILAAKTWWHVKEGDTLYEEDFTRGNRVVDVFWANKRDRPLWFAPPEWKECRLGIQVLPLLPITGIYDRQGALRKIRSLTGHDHGNSLTNLLWWIHSRGDEEDEWCDKLKYCWSSHYH